MSENWLASQPLWVQIGLVAACIIVPASLWLPDAWKWLFRHHFRKPKNHVLDVKFGGRIIGELSVDPVRLNVVKAHPVAHMLLRASNFFRSIALFIDERTFDRRAKRTEDGNDG